MRPERWRNRERITDKKATADYNNDENKNKQDGRRGFFWEKKRRKHESKVKTLMGDHPSGEKTGKNSTTPTYAGTPTTRASRKRALEQVNNNNNSAESEMGKTPKRDRKHSDGSQPGNAAPGPGAGPAPPPPPNPGVPPSSSSGDYATTEFILQMEKRLTSGFSSRLDKIEEHVLNNAAQIKEVKASIDAREVLLEGRLNRQIEIKTKEAIGMIKNDAQKLTTTGHANLRSLSEKQIESYNFHRRTLRVWPVKGPEVARAMKSFIQSKLKIVGVAYDALGKMELKKERVSNPRFPEEIIVTFESKEARDTVKAAGRNLSGDPSAGMRLNIPGFLLDNYRILASVGYNIKENQRDVKRAIKFDDDNMDLMLDVRVNDEWRRITPDEARVAARNNPNIRIGPKKLKGGDIAALLGKEKSKSDAQSEDEDISEVVVIPASSDGPPGKAANGSNPSSKASGVGAGSVGTSTVS